MAVLIIERVDALLAGIMHWPAFNEWKRSKGEFGFLENLLRYAAVVEFVSKCHETIQKVIEDYEERARIMRARLDLLGDYTQALDPIRASGNKIVLPSYSIFEDHSRGTTRSTAEYLIPEALKPFWDILQTRHLVDRMGYRQSDESYHFESLKELVQRFRWLLDEIKKGRVQAGDPPDVKKLCGISNRLPFSKEEVAELQKLCNELDLLPLKQR